MGLGDIGTIILVLAVGWGVWNFVLSPDAELNRDVGGGLFNLATGNEEGVEKAVKKLGPKLKSGLDSIQKHCGSECKDGGLGKPGTACQKCAEKYSSVIREEARSAYAYSY